MIAAVVPYRESASHHGGNHRRRARPVARLATEPMRDVVCEWPQIDVPDVHALGAEQDLERAEESRPAAA